MKSFLLPLIFCFSLSLNSASTPLENRKDNATPFSLSDLPKAFFEVLKEGRPEFPHEVLPVIVALLVGAAIIHTSSCIQHMAKS